MENHADTLKPAPNEPLQTVTETIRRTAAGSRFLAVLLLLIALFVFFSVTQSAFFTTSNLDTMLTSVSILFMVSIGMTFVMLSSGLDLSVGSILALTGVLVGKLFVDAGLPIGLVIVIALVAGAALGGLVNGFLIGPLGLSFLVVTLGTSIAFRGLVNIWGGTETDQVFSPFLESLAFDKFVGVPNSVWLMAAVFAIALYVLRRTYFGRDVYAIGGNPAAARLSGINTARTVMIVYAIAGLLAAVGSVIQVARVGSASPLVGETIIFDAAAAVLLGGTSFAGGVGGVTGTLVGVLFLGVLQNGLAVSGVQSFWQQVITGAILVLAVLIDRIQRDGWTVLRLKGTGDL